MGTSRGGKSIFRERPSVISEWMESKGFSGTYMEMTMGYFKTKSSVSNGTLFDNMMSSLESTGFTGTLQERLDKFFEDKTSIANDRLEAERVFWRDTSLDFGVNALLSEDGFNLLSEDGQILEVEE